MTPEDIGDIFQELEDALFAMAIRNMDAHKAWEEKEGFKWTQWQAEQIKGLRQYREKVNLLTNKGFDKAKKGIERFLQKAYEGSVNDAAGFAVKAGKGSISPAFFGVNSQKMDIMLEEAVKDIDTKRYACINRMNSGYTDFLRKADIFAQSGSMTIPQALDHAMKDFLSAGLNCVEYSNGNRVNIASYAEMALRTSSSEVTRQANGDVRNALDEYLVVSNVIGMTCPICQKWQGKVLIDDVYSDGKPDGKHQLVSDAKADGFMHPNCRHQLYMYLEGITEIAELPNDVETKEHYKAEQEQRRQEREIRKYKRLRDGAVDPADRQKYDARVKEWTAKHNQFLSEHDYLRKNPKRLAPGYMGNGRPEGKVAERQPRRNVLNNQYSVNPVVNTSEYEDAIRKLGESDEITKSIVNGSREILDHRKGTEYEDLMFISADNRSLIRNDYNVTRECIPSRGMIQLVNDAPPYSVIAIHNHPGSSIPGKDDIDSLIAHKYKYGLIVGHDGSIFKYRKNENTFNRSSALYWLDRLQVRMNDGKSTEDIIDALSSFGLDFEVIR